MNTAYHIDQIARLPLPGDNARQLGAGTIISYQGKSFTLDFTIMEGHRFAVKEITTGEALLSWELPFGLTGNSTWKLCD